MLIEVVVALEHEVVGMINVVEVEVNRGRIRGIGCVAGIVRNIFEQVEAELAAGRRERDLIATCVG